MKNIFVSSEGKGASMTMTGIGTALVTTALMVARYFDIPLTESEVISIVTQVGVIVSAGTILYGSVRKIVNRMGRTGE